VQQLLYFADGGRAYQQTALLPQYQDKHWTGLFLAQFCWQVYVLLGKQD